MPEALPEASSVAATSREAFASWVDAVPEGRTFGQVQVRRTFPEGYSLRHADDADAGGLEVHEDPRSAREIAKLTESGEYRPLKSSPNLRRGWEIRVSDAGDLAVAMNYLYPAGIVHWYLYREGRLGVTSFRENAARQSGIYKRVQRLSDEGGAGRCQGVLRGCGLPQEDPLGRGRGDTAPDGPGQRRDPLPRAVQRLCLLRPAREALRARERDETGLSPSEKEDLAALVEAAGGAGEVEFAREAEFEEPLNERRLRYRRLTLVPRLRPEE